MILLMISCVFLKLFYLNVSCENWRNVVVTCDLRKCVVLHLYVHGVSHRKRKRKWLGLCVSPSPHMV